MLFKLRCFILFTSISLLACQWNLHPNHLLISIASGLGIDALTQRLWYLVAYVLSYLSVHYGMQMAIRVCVLHAYIYEHIVMQLFLQITNYELHWHMPIFAAINLMHSGVGCDMLLTDHSAYLLSPGYPSKTRFPKGTICTYTILLPLVRRIGLYWEFFKLSKGCGLGKIEVSSWYIRCFSEVQINQISRNN